jgi:hypothetical protein
MSKFIFIEPERHKLATSICEAAGIADPNQLRRIVIDLRVGDSGLLYLEVFGDDSVLDVDIAELGIEVKEVTRDDQGREVFTP